MISKFSSLKGMLTQLRAYTPDPLEYIKFLDEGLKAFRKEQVAMK